MTKDRLTAKRHSPRKARRGGGRAAKGKPERKGLVRPRPSRPVAPSDAGPGGDSRSQSFSRDIDALMAFRLAYLRAIAAYWRDEDEFKAKLKEVEAGNKTNHQKVLEAFCPGYNWVWNVDLCLEPDAGIEWGVGGNAGWSGPPNEITIYLPLSPRAEHTAEAFAAYYSRFPTFFGDGSPEPSRIVAAAGAGGVIGPLPLGMGGLQQFLEFGAVVARAIALCWQEEHADSDQPIRDALLEDGNIGLMHYLGYGLPWNMKLYFKPAPADCSYEPGNGSQVGRWQRLPPNGLKLHLPDRPENLEASSLAVALAAYNNTGDAYPLTCGC